MSTEMLENYPRLLLYTLFTDYMKEKVRILARTMQLLCNWCTVLYTIFETDGERKLSQVYFCLS